MKVEPQEISPGLKAMLRKSGRHDLIESGFEIHDDALEASRRMTRDPDHAVYHALFDRGAPHAAVISPVAAPDSLSSNDDLLKWTIAKQTEAAQLERNHAGQLAAGIATAIAAVPAPIVASLEALAEAATERLSMDLGAAGEAVGAVVRGAASGLASGFTASIAAQTAELTVQAIESRAQVGAAVGVAHADAVAAKVGAEARYAGQMDSLESIRRAVKDGAWQAELLVAEVKAQGAAETERYQERATAFLRFHNASEAAAARRDRATALRHWIGIAILLGILAGLFASRAHAQPATPLVVQVQSGGTTIGTRSGGLLQLNCGTATFSSNKWTCNTAGATGATGPSGPSGPAGANGATGATGATGPSGPSGPSGANGAAGASGPSGPSGPSGATGTAFPNSGNVGSVIVASFGNSATAVTVQAGGNSNAACATFIGYWGYPGYLRGAVVTTTTTNSTVPMRANINWDCTGVVNAALGPSPGGAVVPPGAAAGSFVDTSTANYYHEVRGAQTAFSWTKQSGAGTAAAVLALAMEFVDDNGVYATILPSIVNSSASASTTQYLGPYGATFDNAEKRGAIPIPAAGTISNLTVCNRTSPTANATWTVNKNGVGSALTITVVAADAAGCYIDSTHSFSVAAGDYVGYAVVTGASTQTTYGTFSMTFVPTSGTSTILGGSLSAAVSTTATYGTPGTGNPTTTQINNQLGMPIACTAGNLYVTQAVANGGGVTTTFTLQKNGADTAVTGTVTSGSGTGAIALDTTHTASFAKGDLMDLKFITGSGTSGTIGSWTITCN